MTVTVRHMKGQATDRNGLGPRTIIEFLWTIIPPLFTVGLAAASFQHLRPPSAIAPTEAGLLTFAALLLLTSMGILGVRFLQMVRQKREEHITSDAGTPDPNAPIAYGSDEAVFSAPAPSLAIETEALPRGNL